MLDLSFQNGHYTQRAKTQSARLLAPDMLPTDGAFSKSWKYKECLVPQRVPGIKSCLLPVRGLVKAGTGLNATFTTGDLSLSYSQLRMYQHHPCTHHTCWQTCSVQFNGRLIQARADVAASLSIWEKNFRIPFEKYFSRPDCFFPTRHPKYCQAPQLPVVCLSVLSAWGKCIPVLQSQSDLAKGWQDSYPGKCLNYSLKRGRSPFGEKSWYLKHHTSEWKQSCPFSGAPTGTTPWSQHCCGPCYPKQASLQAALWQRKTFQLKSSDIALALGVKRSRWEKMCASVQITSKKCLCLLQKEHQVSGPLTRALIVSH